MNEYHPETLLSFRVQGHCTQGIFVAGVIMRARHSEARFQWLYNIHETALQQYLDTRRHGPRPRRSVVGQRDPIIQKFTRSESSTFRFGFCKYCAAFELSPFHTTWIDV